MAGRRKPRYPRRTQWSGVREIREGVFEARILRGSKHAPLLRARRRFRDLAQAVDWKYRLEKEWEKQLPVQTCENCGAEFKDSRDRPTCSESCSRERIRTRDLRKWRGRSRPWLRVEENVDYDGVNYRVTVRVDGDPWRSVCATLEEARVVRDRYLVQQANRRLKRCPICGAVFRADRSNRVYCTRTCATKARKAGKLVRPSRALPSTRRRAREMEKARIQARRVEILSGPGTFADAYRDVQEILRRHVEKEKREAADSRDPRRAGRPADPREGPTCSTQTTSP